MDSAKEGKKYLNVFKGTDISKGSGYKIITALLDELEAKDKEIERLKKMSKTFSDELEINEKEFDGLHTEIELRDKENKRMADVVEDLTKALCVSNICVRDFVCTGAANNAAQVLSDNSKLIDRLETLNSDT